MKKILLIFLMIAVSFAMQQSATAQCSLCTKTAQQLGEKPAQGLNQGILYILFMPFALMGIIGYRWYKNNKAIEDEEMANHSIQ